MCTAGSHCRSRGITGQVASMADGKERVGKFHPKCSTTVELSEDRRVASGKGYSGSFVFSNDPIPIGLQFSVTILQKSSFFVSPIIAFRPHPSDAPYTAGGAVHVCSPLLPILCVL